MSTNILMSVNLNFKVIEVKKQKQKHMKFITKSASMVWMILQ